jgi:hypothetical protein
VKPAASTGPVLVRRPNTVLPTNRLQMSLAEVQAMTVPELRKFIDQVLSLPMARDATKAQLLNLIMGAVHEL